MIPHCWFDLPARFYTQQRNVIWDNAYLQSFYDVLQILFAQRNVKRNGFLDDFSQEFAKQCAIFLNDFLWLIPYFPRWLMCIWTFALKVENSNTTFAFSSLNMLMMKNEVCVTLPCHYPCGTVVVHSLAWSEGSDFVFQLSLWRKTLKTNVISGP